jgi:acyl-CoA synthetase (AMP-forming)/AMP-acid ligase II
MIEGKVMSKYTVPAMLEPMFEKFPDRVALTFVGENPMTYRQLREQTVQVAGMLASFGIVRGDKVAILSANMPNWGVAFLVFPGLGQLPYPFSLIFTHWRSKPSLIILKRKSCLFPRDYTIRLKMKNLRG